MQIPCRTDARGEVLVACDSLCVDAHLVGEAFRENTQKLVADTKFSALADDRHRVRMCKINGLAARPKTCCTCVPPVFEYFRRQHGARARPSQGHVPSDVRRSRAHDRAGDAPRHMKAAPGPEHHHRLLRSAERWGRCAPIPPQSRFATPFPLCPDTP